MPPLSQPTVLESFWGLPVLQRFRELTRPTARELFVTVLWLFQDSNFSCSHWLLLTLFSPPSSLLTGFLISIAQCTCILSLDYMHLNWPLKSCSLHLLHWLVCLLALLVTNFTSYSRHDASDGITSVELFSSLVCRLTNSLH